ATDDLRGVWRVGRALATGSLALDRLTRPFGDDPRDRDLTDVPKGLTRRLVGFCVVGGLSTLFYLVLYSLFRQFSGSQVANALALLVSAIANTAANRRLTFGVRGRAGAVRHQAQGLVVFGIGLVLTSGSLAALNAAGDNPAHSTELAVLIAANLAATVLRFLLFRAWVFPDRDGSGTDSTAVTAAPYAPLPQRPVPRQQSYGRQSYGQQPYEQPHQTTQVRAGAAGDGSWRDATPHLQPVRPHDTDPGDPR
ncbi:GtrA family protein, partial [Streptomyces sp. NPDC002586]